MATNNEQLISQKYNNYNYAPGIATYGIDGKTGEIGQDGNNIYFTDYDIINTVAELGEILGKIQSNELPRKGLSIKIEHPYKTGDLFFDKFGIIFELYNIDNINESGNYSDYFKIVGKLNAINDTSAYFKINDQRLILNPENYKGFDVISGIDENDASTYINRDAAMNIISNVVNENDNIEMIRLQSVDEVDVEDGQLTVSYKTTDNAYYVDTNKPIVINGDLKLNTDNKVNNEYDEYSTVLTSNDTITYFKYLCDKLRYTILYDTEVNKYKVIIYSIEENEDDQKNTLQYIFNRNESIYGKIYTGENDQILIPLTTLTNTSINSLNYYDYMPDYELKHNIGGVNRPFNFSYQSGDYGILTNITVNTGQMVCNINDNNGIVNIDTYLNLTNNDIGADAAYFDASILNGAFNNNIWAIKFSQDIQYCKANLIKINTYQTPVTYNINEIAAFDVDYGKAIFAKNNIVNSKNQFKYTFNNTNIPINLEIFPLTQNSNDDALYYTRDNVAEPISMQIGYLNPIDIDTCTLYFTLNYSEEKFSINNMMLFRRNDLLNNTVTKRPCIQTYISDNITSIQKFSLLHNTEFFLNYQDEDI